MEKNVSNRTLQDFTEEYSMPITRIDLGGRANKKFVRLDRSLFGDMIDSIQSGDSSYVTYLNDAIRDGYILQYISTMTKDLDKFSFYVDEHAYSDMAGSRVANMLGVKTCYNCLYSEIDKNGKKKPKNLLSVDFLKNNEEMLELNTLYGARLEFSNCLDWLLCIDELIENNQRIIGNIDVQKFLPKINEDLVEQFFLRRLVLADTDYCGRNIAIIVDKKKGSLELCPSYDYDLCNNSEKLTDIRSIADHNMSALIYRYGDVIKRFISRLDRFDANRLHEQLSREIDDETFINRYISRISNNIKALKDCYMDYNQGENTK